MRLDKVFPQKTFDVAKSEKSKKGKKAELKKIVGELNSIEDDIGFLEMRQEELRDKYYEISGERYIEDYRE